jgi:predicted RNA-binding protein with PUA-like domain
MLFLYGPFRRGGKHTADSNEAFDASLRRANPEWGVRDVEAVEKLAANAGLSLVEITEMPANNFTLVFAHS